MAWNPEPKVADCRDIARKWNKKQVIIIAVGEDTLEYASYGQTPMLCKEARSMADVAYDAIYKRLSVGGIEESLHDIRDDHDDQFVKERANMSNDPDQGRRAND